MTVNMDDYLAGLRAASTEWRQVAGLPHFVSDVGLIRGVRKQPLRMDIWAGYVRVTLEFNCRRHHIKVHRLVYETFVGPIPQGIEINHRDGVKTNNHWRNLELATRLQNVQHAEALGLVPRMYGKRNGKTTLTDAEVRAIRSLFRSGIGKHELAARFGVAHRVIWDVIQRRTWKHVLDEAA